MRGLLAVTLSALVAVFLVAPGVPADEEMSDGEMGRSASSMLSPPAEDPAQPEARGEVVINPMMLLVKIEDVLAGVYSVQLDDGTGAIVEIGTIPVLQDREKPEKPGKPEDPGMGKGGDEGEEEEEEEEEEGDDEEDDMGLGGGILKLSGTSLPFGAAAPADLGGRAIQVVLDEAVIVSGMTPMVMVKDPTPKSGRCPLALPDPPVDPDARGVLKLESADGRAVIKVHLFSLEPRTVYEVIISAPPPEEEDPLEPESLGQTTTNPAGNASFMVDTEKGDPMPFGVGDLAMLVGYDVQVVDPDGNAVLVGKVCEPQIQEDDGEGEGEGEDPPVEDPPVEDPPVEDPPVEDPPVEDPPVEDPPVDPPPGEDAGVGAEVVEPMFRILGEYDTPFLRGDSNSDRVVDIADPIHLLNFLFRGGERPHCMDAADVNDDGTVDLSDPISTLMYLFAGSTQPAYPGPRMAGSDRTADALFCEDPGL